MTEAQIATNHRAVLAATAKLERLGYKGEDAYAFVESLLMNAHADGWRTVDRPPALRGPSSTPEARRAARDLYQQIRREKEQQR